MIRIGLVLMALMSVAGAAQAGGVATEVSLDTGTGELAATLLVPDRSGPWPSVVIIAGSGPTDRDGNSTMFPGKNNCYKQLAEALVEQGIASLRYDKRGVAGSEGAAKSEVDLRFDDFIADAGTAIAFLQADPRFSSVTTVGHSQGGQIAMSAGWRNDADGVVCIAGPGRPILDVLESQLWPKLSGRSKATVKQIMDELAAGRTVPEPPDEWLILFRPSVQPFLISWQMQDPVQDAARIAVPFLIVQGTEDIQVSVEDAELLAAANSGARLEIVEGMNHLFRPIPRENLLAQQTSLVDSTLQVMPEVVAAVADLVRQADAQAKEIRDARARALEHGRKGQRVIPSDQETEWLVAEQGRPTGERVGAWARRLLEAGGAEYLFGPAESGYVAEGALVLDDRQDCVSFLYRTTELARAQDSEDAVRWALRTRFAGVDPASAVDGTGRVDYENPGHLDFSLDMIRSGNWGRDATPDLGGAIPDSIGTTRYPAGSFDFIPGEALVESDLQEGDIAWLVLNPANEKANKLRHDYGLVIGHIGIIVIEDGQPWLVHAARSELKGWYEGGTVVKVPLAEYLSRVERFSGVMVTRF